MSRDPVTRHSCPVNVEQAHDLGILFSLDYDHTQVEKSGFFHRINASHAHMISYTDGYNIYARIMFRI
jgi:hypothetical protein